MSDQRGQATPLLALLVLAVGGFVFGLARFGATVTHAAQSQAAADAAALAAAAGDGRAGAESLAARNGGSVATYEEDGAEVEVRVVVGDTWAVARARRDGGGAGGGRGVAGWVGVSSRGGVGRSVTGALRTALEAAAELLHQPVPIAAASGTAVAVPGHFAARLDAIADRIGLCRLPSSTDPVRFAPCRVRPR